MPASKWVYLTFCEWVLVDVGVNEHNWIGACPDTCTRKFDGGCLSTCVWMKFVDGGMWMYVYKKVCGWVLVDVHVHGFLGGCLPCVCGLKFWVGMLVDVRVDGNLGWVLTDVRATSTVTVACGYACAFNFFCLSKFFVQGGMY